MTDKVQKIREEVERMHNLLPIMDGDNISVNYADRICTTLEMYIDSLQEEPVSEDLPKIIDRETLDEYAYQCAYDMSNDWARENATWKDVQNACKLGANWQKAKDQSNIELTEDQARRAVEIARKEMISKLRKWVSSKNKRDSFTFGYIDRHFDELLKHAMKDET